VTSSRREGKEEEKQAKERKIIETIIGQPRCGIGAFMFGAKRQESIEVSDHCR
jgi:hypothetical protein